MWLGNTVNHLWNKHKHCSQRKIEAAHVYIYTRFRKGFHIERYIDRYVLLFSCTCARVHFSPVIVQLVKKLASTIIFFFDGFFFSHLKRICHFEFFWFFFRKMHALCDANLQWRIIWLILGMRKTSREAADPRVIRRHRIGRPNAMASVASDEAFLLMECIKKCAVQERA